MNKLKGEKDKNMKSRISLKNLKKSSKGITLIALVITIIVLLILAAVSIATLTGQNGILTRANDAAEETGRKTAEEKVAVEVLGSYGKDGNIDYDLLNKNLKNVEGLTSGLPISKLPATVVVDGYKVEIDGDGNVTAGNSNPIESTITIDEAKEESMLNNKEDSKVKVDDGTVTVPAGFQIAQDSGSTIDEGIVIEDIKSNQFVWVPVKNYSEFERRAGYSDGAEQPLTNVYGEADSSGNNTNSEVIETAVTQIEAQAMYDSVRRNKGFYIGRYEAGKDSSNNVVVQKGVDVYNKIPWSTNGETQETNNTTGGAVEIARNFDTLNNYTTVTSTLCYGVQWDAIMKWMEGIENENAIGSLTKYIQDSTGKGWYGDNSGNKAHQTGMDVDADKSNCVKNIYDLAGNVREWTMESYGTGVRIRRGGSYGYTGSYYPASFRYSNTPSDNTSYVGFRIALYLNN